jgi:hypothetical protein
MLIDLSKEEIAILKNALKESGLEFTNNIVLYDKLCENEENWDRVLC